MAPWYHLRGHLIALLLFLSFPAILHGQQPYTGQAFSNCGQTSVSNSLQGYLCGAQTPTNTTRSPSSCDTYLTFHPQPPYQTPLSISTLLAADPSNISQSNSLPPGSPSSTPFPPSTAKILVPIRCSCTGSAFYQANTTYSVRNDDTLLTIANNTFQGLSTCQAIDAQNPLRSPDLVLAGSTLTVPLRCACPSAAQAADGVRYLLSYLVEPGDDTAQISRRFGVDINSVFAANGLTFRQSTIYPFTTLLVPLKAEPTVLQLDPTATTQGAPPPPATAASPSGGSKSSTGIIVGISVGVVCVLVLMASGFLFYSRRQRKNVAANKRNRRRRPMPSAKPAPKAAPLDLSTNGANSMGSLLSGISDLKFSLKQYKYGELQLATNNFSASCLIGDSTYRANFNGDAAAICIMNHDALKEIDILKKFNHSSLIGLSGACFHDGRWYLVYEYAANGSLSDWLFDTTGSKVLSWVQRVQIALDVANGLNYLHNFTEPSYVHKDVRSANILLDANFKAKIVNFGLARSLDPETTQPVLTRHIVGTQGYLAPEYLEHGIVTPKLDVYAFGVVMMELITGKDVAAQPREGEAFLGDAVAGVFNQEAAEDWIKDYVDPLLHGYYAPLPTLIMARLAARCLKPDVGSRPTMDEIVQSLSGVLAASMASVLPRSSSTSERYSGDAPLLT